MATVETTKDAGSGVATRTGMGKADTFLHDATEKMVLHLRTDFGLNSGGSTGTFQLSWVPSSAS